MSFLLISLSLFWTNTLIITPFQLYPFSHAISFLYIPFSFLFLHFYCFFYHLYFLSFTNKSFTNVYLTYYTKLSYKKKQLKCSLLGSIKIWAFYTLWVSFSLRYIYIYIEVGEKRGLVHTMNMKEMKSSHLELSFYLCLFIYLFFFIYDIFKSWLTHASWHIIFLVILIASNVQINNSYILFLNCNSIKNSFLIFNLCVC